jgi:uncharacterized Zn-finger protein
LNRHMKSKHLECSRKFACEICGIKFTYMSHLRRHYGTQMNMVSPQCANANVLCELLFAKNACHKIHIHKHGNSNVLH